MKLFALNVGPVHMIQKCAMHLQGLKKRKSASTVAARVTYQEDAQADQMIIGRNQGQHLGTSWVKEQVTQVIKTMFPTKTDSHHQTRFDERYNWQYSPNYSNSHQSTLRLYSRPRFK